MIDEFKRETIDDLIDVMERLGTGGFFSSLSAILEYIGGEQRGMEPKSLTESEAQDIRKIKRAIDRMFGVD